LIGISRFTFKTQVYCIDFGTRRFDVLRWGGGEKRACVAFTSFLFWTQEVDNLLNKLAARD